VSAAAAAGVTVASRRGLVVAAAGVGINLALGILYAWSVLKGGIPPSWHWSDADKALPYSVACMVFAMAMIPAGALQDRIGPRWVATFGGVLTGLGCIVASLSGSSLAGFVLGFGVLVGVGMGFGYAAATPPAVKWFPPQKTGMVAGAVVAGFGLASVYIAPLATKLLDVFARPGAQGVLEKGISTTMLVFGVGFLVMVTALAQLLANPPAGFVPAAPVTGKPAAAVAPDVTWRQMLRTPQFYVLWVMYFAGSAAGLTYISVAQGLGKKSLGEWAFLAVVVLAVGNAGGRILAGVISDRIGRPWTLFGAFVVQASALLGLYLAKGGAAWPQLMIILLLIGGNYGANLALFPAFTKESFGLKNFGMNYGVLFSAWGAAGLVMPWLNGKISDRTGSGDLTFFIILGLLALGAMLTFVSRSQARARQRSLATRAASAAT
jgi:MFS family permease